MTARKRRDMLDGLPPATCYRTHTQPDENLGVYGAVWLADVRRALTRREPLDVEVLARALHINDTDTYDTCPQTLSGWHRQTAEVIAAEYARLEAER